MCVQNRFEQDVEPWEWGGRLWGRSGTLRGSECPGEAIRKTLQLPSGNAGSDASPPLHPASRSVLSSQGLSQRPPPPRSSPDFLLFLFKLDSTSLFFFAKSGRRCCCCLSPSLLFAHLLPAHPSRCTQGLSRAWGPACALGWRSDRQSQAPVLSSLSLGFPGSCCWDGFAKEVSRGGRWL